MKKTKLTFWLALSWLAFTTVLLCLPGSVFPKEKWFDKIWLDKWIHIGLFSIMVILWCRFIKEEDKKKTRFFVQLSFYFLLYGVAMEFVQKYFIPNRSFDVKDIMADGIGCALGLFTSVRLL